MINSFKSMIWLVVLTVILSACTPALAPSRSSESPWNSSTPQDTLPDGTLPVTREISGQIESCSSPASDEADSLIELSIETNDEGLLTYCIRLVPVGAENSVAPDLRIHLPQSMSSAQTSGAGWVCERNLSAQDDVLPGVHIDEFCRSASVQARYPGLVRIVIPADDVKSDDRVCVQAILKTSVELACLPVETSE